MSECYITGKITVNTKNGFTNVGGSKLLWNED